MKEIIAGILTAAIFAVSSESQQPSNNQHQAPIGPFAESYKKEPFTSLNQVPVYDAVIPTRTSFGKIPALKIRYRLSLLF